MTKKKESAPTYTKEQFLASKRYTAQQKDVLDALLEDGEAYSALQVKKLLDEFLKKEAK